MIVHMKHLDLVGLANDREKMLTALRELGAVHLDLSTAQGAAVSAAKNQAADAERAVRTILSTRGKTPKSELEIRPRSVAEVLALIVDRATLKDEFDRLEREIKYFAPYGDFDPSLAQKIIDRGVDIAEALPERMPEMRLSRLEEKRDRVSNRMLIDDAKIMSVDEAVILKQYPQLADQLAFEQAKEIMSDAGALTYVSGWLPEPMIDRLTDSARKQGWATLIREPEAGETPPTLLKPPRIFQPMVSLFSGLGISPGYTEADVSVPFMCYFSLFFAMLVGDGAYGAIFLAATLALRKKMSRQWLVLMTTFSTATIVWGLLSNTWFGAGLPFAREWPTVKWLADPSYNHIMLLCFTIGVSHLMLARIWNGLCKLNDTTCIAEFGWAGVLLSMYLVTNTIVGIFSGFPNWGLWLFGASIIAVFGFSVKPSELKTRGAELGMLPLNIMGALGDIISYVRLFAVGLASVKVAENFNEMAINLFQGADEWWLKILMAIAMVAIMAFGHVLNLMMAGLSVLVHAVRLNTLEFSNHKGITWAGYEFRPFKRHLKE